MKVERMTEIETSDIKVGDRIHVRHYTATCQEITPKGALFLLDQYLDKAFPMNWSNTNKGGYEESDLRETLRSKEILDLFDDWGDRMIPFDNGDLLRIPFFGEIFGQEDAEYFEPDGCEQWELMKDRKNRIAFRKNCWEWGWLQNKRKGSAANFAYVGSYGYAAYNHASSSIGVRPAFLIAPKGALFLLDQYLDKAYPMNRRNTNKGGYPESDLRKALQSDEVLDIFADIRDLLDGIMKDIQIAPHRNEKSVPVREPVRELATLHEAIGHRQWLDSGEPGWDVRSHEPMKFGKEPIPEIERVE